MFRTIWNSLILNDEYIKTILELEFIHILTEMKTYTNGEIPSVSCMYRFRYTSEAVLATRGPHCNFMWPTSNVYIFHENWHFTTYKNVIIFIDSNWYFYDKFYYCTIRHNIKSIYLSLYY